MTPDPYWSSNHIYYIYRERTRLVRCFESYATLAVQEQLWLLLRDPDWMSAGPITAINRFYIPEQLVTWCLLIDSTLRPIPQEDWRL